MMKKLLLALGACVLPVSIFAATYVVPVATARLKDRIYSTTLAFHNEGSLLARCEAIYAVPNDPKGGTLRATYEIAAGGAPLVEEDVLRDVGAIGTMRIACTSDVAIAVRIQSSSAGLLFDEGRTFAALREDGAAHGALPAIRAFGDVVVAEVAGKPVTVEAIVRDLDGVEFGSKTYEVPALGQQLVNLSKAHAHANVAIVDIHVIAGDGAIVGADETRDIALLKMAVRMRPETRVALNVQARKMASANTTSSPASSVIRSLGTAAFKAAPFQDPFTGLVFMRERWYDPQTGTFLSTDPEGYADSANLYSYCHGDPVNCTDPTGRLGDGGDLRADFREKENAARKAAYAKWCRENPAACSEQQRKLANRGAGIGRAIGGGLQVVGGVGVGASTGPLPEPVTKTIAAVNIERGLENFGAGVMQVITGEQYETPSARAIKKTLVAAGVQPNKAATYTRRAETTVDVAAGLAAGGAGAYNAWKSAVVVGDAAPFSRVLSASEINTLTPAAPGSDTVILGPYSIVGETGVADTAATLEQTAARLGGRTLTTYPRDINVLGQQIRSADRIIFYTYRNLAAHPTTAAEMQLIQSDPILRAKTIFVYGGLAEP